MPICEEGAGSNSVREDVQRTLRDAKIQYTGLAVKRRRGRGPHHQGHRSGERAFQIARAVAAARRPARLQRPARPRRDRCRRRPDPAGDTAGGDDRSHAQDHRAVDPDRRAPRQRARYRRAADPAPGQRPHPGAGAGPAGPDPSEGNPGQDRQDGIPHGRHDRVAGSGAGGQGAAGLRSADERVARRRFPMSSRSRCWSPAATSPTRRPASTSDPASRSSISSSTPRARANSRRRPPKMSAALCDRARQRGDLRARDPRAHHRRAGPDLRQFHRAIRQRSRDPAARRRAAGAAHRGRGAHGRSGPRPGFDREGRTRGLCRLDHGHRVHAADLPAVRRVRQHRGDDQRRHDLRRCCRC